MNTPFPGSTPTAKPRWAVVGGGLLGMTLAHRLAQGAQPVTVFEAAPDLGGLASAWSLGDVVWDRHYHVTLQSDLDLRALLAELDLESQIRWVQTRTGFYTRRGLLSMSNALEFCRFPVLGPLDKLRLAATIVYASRIRNWKRLEAVPVSEWLQRWSGRRTFERLWLPLLRSKLGESYERTSAAFIWATINRMYAARRSGLKKEMFGYVSGGYARILARFAEVLEAEGVTVRRSAPVSSVRRLENGTLAVESSAGPPGTFEQVVLTVPFGVAALVCPDLTAAEKDRLKGVAYQGIVCLSLLLTHPLSDFYITNLIEGGAPFTAVIEMSALVDRKEFGGRSLVYLPKYAAPDDPIFDLPDADIERRFVDALVGMHPHLDRRAVICSRLSRVKHVYPLPTLCYSDHLPPTTTSVHGLHLINSAHIVNGTLNVNETVRLADSMSRRLLPSRNQALRH